MSPERWRQIEEFYHSAREKGREVLVGVDPSLRREVERLLEQDSEGKILDRPAAGLIPPATVTQLTPGKQLGPYRIERLLGAGGMGEVFRAVDTRLGRAVAIKTCREQFSERFYREARAISSLNHPNICALYDIGPNYLVMELVEGETLAAQLKKGALATGLVLRYGLQIADALASAHAKGIIHRDLKPANVMVTKSGIKILDFGLAKVEGDVLTAKDVIMGTPAYMAPEQSEGKETDSRTDIFALGLMLYEMAAGKRPGEERAAVQPVALDRVIGACLARDPEERLQSARDVKRALEWAIEPEPDSVPATPRRWWIVTAAIAILGAVALVLFYIGVKPQSTLLPSRLKIPLPDDVTFLGSPPFAVSPDGRRIVFYATKLGRFSGRLWIRDLESLEVRPLPDTEGPQASPFWSPDSRFVVFDAGGTIKKIDVSGGPPQVLCDMPVGTYGGSWNRNEPILVGTTKGVMRIAAGGGTPSPLTLLDDSRQEQYHGYPTFLPDGTHFLYLRASSAASNSGLYVGSIESKPEGQSEKQLLATEFQASYMAPLDRDPGRLLFIRGGVLLAQQFNTGRMELMGEPAVAAESVAVYVTEGSGLFSISANGVLVYRAGETQNLRLTWFDRQGKVLDSVGESARYMQLRLSPDETRAAVIRTDARTSSLVLVDLMQGTTTRLGVVAGTDRAPVFSSDGSRLAFTSNRNNVWGTYVRKANGAGGEELLARPTPCRFLNDWSPDGHFLLCFDRFPKTGWDVWVIPTEKDRKPFPFLQTTFHDFGGNLSPDGRWIAYRSDETGRDELYVQRFVPTPEAGASAAGGKYMLTRGGGIEGVYGWRADGRELYYMNSDAKIMAVEMTPDPVFKSKAPIMLFQAPESIRRMPAFASLVAASRDGQRFLVGVPLSENTRDEFTVVLNWPAALKK